jgi:hypothetical protein
MASKNRYGISLKRRNTMGHPNKPLLQHTFLNAVVGTSNGVWWDVSGWNVKNIQVSGIIGDTVRVYGSNNPTCPANSADGVQVGADITVDNTSIASSVPWLWMKVKISTAGTGTISAWGVGTQF